LDRWSHPSCSFAAKTELGLETHVSRVHSSNNFGTHAGTNADNDGSRNFAGRKLVTIPRSFIGTKKRLRIDDVTHQLQRPTAALEHDAKYNDMYQSMHRDHFPEFSDPNPVKTIDVQEEKERKSLEKLAFAFILLSRSSSDRFCNDLLQVLFDNIDYLADFVRVNRSMKDVRSFIDRFVRESIERDGYMSHTLVSASGLKFQIYAKNSVELLRKQVELTDRADILTDPNSSELRSHPMNSNIGNKACRAAKKS